jgi:mRNA interferase MazF
VKRGDLVTVTVSGDYGKPRPALIVQADMFAEHPSLTVLPLTSDLVDAPLLRITIDPSEANGLRRRSQAMVDKITTIPRRKAGRPIGSLDLETMQQVTRALAIFLGILQQ